MRSLLGKKLKPAYLGGFWVLLIFIILFGFNVVALDPDLGWHLRLGQVITQSGIPKTDPFSYTMPSYSYVDVEWLANVIFAKTYALLGFFGLALFTTLLTTITLVLVCGLENWPLFLLAATPILSFILVRPMVVTWFFLALIVVVIFNPQRWKKWRILVPGLFFLWANLHAGMASGMALLIIFIAVRTIRLKQLSVLDVVICLVSFLATLLNPYGLFFWREIGLTVFHLGVGAQIAELMPVYSGFDPASLTIAVLSAVLVWRYRKKIVWETSAVYLFFLIAGFFWIRNLPLMIIVSVPIISQGITWLSKEVSVNKEQKRRLTFVSRLAIGYCLILFFGQLIIAGFNQTKMSEDHFYPKRAVSYLKNNLPVGQIFSEYGWGGYLDWKLPEKKVFIDGRMPYWQSKSLSIFKEYNDISEGKKDLDKTFTKYGIETVLWSTKKNSGFDFEKALLKIRWKKIYQDQVSVIYTK